MDFTKAVWNGRTPTPISLTIYNISPHYGAILVTNKLDWSAIDVAFLDNLISIWWFPRITTFNNYKNFREVKLLTFIYRLYVNYCRKSGLGDIKTTSWIDKHTFFFFTFFLFVSTVQNCALIHFGLQGNFNSCGEAKADPFGSFSITRTHF